MYTYDSLLHLDLESSSLCNALCPVCNRRDSGGIKNKDFVETYITLARFKEWFRDDMVSNLFSIQLCGNYGDAMTNPELIPILEHVKILNPEIKITMNTNASGRNPQFWKDLGRLVGNNGHVTFSIDGLEDTNHIYRRGTHWDKIMMAVKNYISTGASARWDYLIFKHNQHQIEEAKQLSIDLGFEHFMYKKALGFISNDKNRVGMEGIYVLNDQGQLDYMIEPPSNSKFQNSVIREYLKNTKFTKHEGEDVESPQALKTFNIEKNTPKHVTKPFIEDRSRPLTEWEHKLGNTEIHCAVIEPKSLFVSSEGLVFPCCFTASKYYAGDNEEVAQLKKFINDFGRNNISLHHNSLEDIIDGPMFQERWVENFNDNDIRGKRLRTCSIFCGKDTNSEMKETFESVTIADDAIKLNS